VKKAYANEEFIGFVVRNENASQSSLEMLKECGKIGISNHQTHENRNIVYVNRYDWSCHHGSSKNVETELKNKRSAKKKLDEEVLEEMAQELCGGRLFLVDAKGYIPFIKCIANKNSSSTLKNSLTFEIGSTSTENNNENKIGIQLSHDDIEYELGWLIFSGKKHDDFTGSDELVGMVYDSTYSALDPLDEGGSGSYTVS
jgi:hypothetical protein